MQGLFSAQENALLDMGYNDYMPKPVRTIRVNIKVSEETANAVQAAVDALSTNREKWTTTDVYEAAIAAYMKTPKVREALSKIEGGAG